ncbi:uncharacterized protein GGS22DRAFT_51014 [Annulohypoxylon maeteangense]|uniref:uncharacterized protein n=1 Tax=Annulohypoxylon maeteangense TaxID=1927788 RepID=UPI0020077F32|nr:uncharacterized protein GGS22DRAFT_51014 [Annulohypoxylon maeteangense]KAI0882379.1 hypothetical protein GGS22DRAFT_51014 [Annulohypoxylon maeteangense]
MPSFSSSILSLTSLLALTQAHGVILNAQGIAGSPASVGFKVEKDLARNCTSISPCQQDTTIIRDAEIAANVVNECGRTELSGNIDIGENTENALAAKAVTQVKAGTQVKVTIHQVNADGAGPYVCDLVEAGNNGVITQNLTVQNNVPGVNGFSQAKTQDFDILVNMPTNFACTGSSAGNVCTVRCRNNALAGPFGGCFPVQQVDVTPAQNTPANIKTSLSLEKVFAQVAQDQKDLPAAIAAIKDAGANEALQNVAVVSSILGDSVTSLPASVQTPNVATGAAATATSATSAAKNTASTTTKASAAKTSAATSKNGNGRGNNNNGNANGNANNANGNANNANGNANNANGNANNANGNANNAKGNANGNANAANQGAKGQGNAANNKRRAAVFVA